MDVAGESAEVAQPAKPSPLLPVVLVIVIGGAWLGGYVWYNHRSFGYTSPEGYSLDLPKGWLGVAGKGGGMNASGPLPGGGSGSAVVVILPSSGGSPHEALSNRGPDIYEETKIDGKTSGIAVYDDGELRCLEAVVTGKRYLRFTIQCRKKNFEEHRARFERCARSIQWQD